MHISSTAAQTSTHVPKLVETIFQTINAWRVENNRSLKQTLTVMNDEFRQRENIWVFKLWLLKVPHMWWYTWWCRGLRKIQDFLFSHIGFGWGIFRKHTMAKNQLFIQKLPRIWCLKNVNFVKSEILKLWILCKMRF